MEDSNKKEVIQFGKGLYTDSSPQVQPKGTLRFALNCIDETEVGDMLFPSNMESNIEAGSFPTGYTPIGKVYIGNGENVVFLVGPDGESEFGIYDDKGIYTTYVNDKDLNSKLNFKITHQIDAVYRLRRGCDRTIYWTDNLNPIRQYVLNKPEDYLVGGVFSVDSLNLFKRWSSTPKFTKFSVLDTGNLKAGSYNFAIQYLDSDLNPTEWIITSDTINIYHGNLTQPYRDLQGSSNVKTEYQDWGESTGKSIQIELDNLDTDFNFYRIGIIEATAGTGMVSKVTASAPISTGVNKYIFTGNSETVITVEEIAQFSNVIETAQSIEQIENRLLLGNTKGKQINFCNLQEYASKIVANYVVNTVILDQIDEFKGENLTEAGSRDPLINHKKLGYMPGEIYSFGIVYYFKDGSVSPVYHIPGKPANDSGVSNMSTDNVSEDKYTDSSNCEDSDYWGKDYMENILKNTPIRHHRFPTRKEANLNFVQEDVIVEESNSGYNLVADITIPIETVSTKYVITFTGTFNNTPISKTVLVFSSTTAISNYSFVIAQEIADAAPTYSVQVEYSPSEPVGISLSYHTEASQITSPRYGYKCDILGIKFSNITVPTLEGNNEIVGYKIVRNVRDEDNKTILDTGVLFPISEYEKFLGYGHSIPNLTGDINFGIRQDIYAFINPEFLFNKKEYRQNNIEFIYGGEFARYDEKIKVDIPGRKVEVGDRVFEDFVEDTYPGTTYDPAYHAGGEKDTDGLTLHTITRYRDTEFKKFSNYGEAIFNSGDIEEMFYLDALSSKTVAISSQSKDVFNISSDNRIGIVQLKENITSPFSQEALKTVRVPKYMEVSSTEPLYEFSDVLKLDPEYSDIIIPGDYYSLPMESLWSTPYFYMRRKLSNPYSNFRYIPYYAEHDNVIPISQPTVEIFNGDTYISPMTYNNSFFHDIKPKKRKVKKHTWKFITGGLLILGGVAGLIFTGGASAALIGLGASAITVGASFINSGITGNKMNNIYQEKYEEGLKYISRDGTTGALFLDNATGLSDKIIDDEIQWYNEVINGIWFESQVNLGVRQGNTAGVTSFIPSPYQYALINQDIVVGEVGLAKDASNEYFRRRSVEKLTVLDPESDGGRLYLGFATAEQYEVNKDLQRREKEKPFFHLGLEFDCCSDCVETFPHRVYYSEQSFQEENVDNFRVFLPNNYRDINGETGEIKNIFKIQNELFIHTEEAIWKLPKNYQERITDEIVSFIGTGSYFSIPPQKLVDDETGNSFGTRHKWSRLKTPVGYFFVSEGQNAICMFDGNRISNISKLGNYYWFYNNIPILSDTPYRDNPSNPNGSGFIAVYDSKKDLIFFTKKDKLPTGENTSWTVSYNLKKNSWGSWHSFMPNFYLQTPQWYFSWITGNDNIWRHNVLGHYQTYYGTLYPYIIEYVLTENALQNKIFEDITVYLESKKYDSISKTFYDTNSHFFTKLLAYNSRQCTGVLNIVVKDKEDINFFSNQIKNLDLQNVIADRNERNWTINDLRDMVVTKEAPLFISDIKQLQSEYFIDKKLNNAVIDYNKNWTQIESFRDKYLVVRFIFDTFADIKLITNFTTNTEGFSIR